MRFDINDQDGNLSDVMNYKKYNEVLKYYRLITSSDNPDILTILLEFNDNRVNLENVMMVAIMDYRPNILDFIIAKMTWIIREAHVDDEVAMTVPPGIISSLNNMSDQFIQSVQKGHHELLYHQIFNYIDQARMLYLVAKDYDLSTFQLFFERSDKNVRNIRAAIDGAIGHKRRNVDILKYLMEQAKIHLNADDYDDMIDFTIEITSSKKILNYLNTLR